MPNILKLMQAAKEMQKNVESTQKKLSQTSIEGESNGVKVITNGQHFCLEVVLPNGDTAMAESIKDAINQCNDKIKAISQSEFSSLAEQMNLGDK